MNPGDPTSQENSTIKDDPTGKTSIKLARLGLVSMGLIWLVFGIYSQIRISGGSSSLANYAWIISGLMFINGGILISIGWRLGEGRRFTYFLALLVLAVNIPLTITDEFGVFDLVTLLIAIGIFILLLSTRSVFLTINQTKEHAAEEP